MPLQMQVQVPADGAAARLRYRLGVVRDGLEVMEIPPAHGDDEPSVDPVTLSRHDDCSAAAVGNQLTWRCRVLSSGA